MNAYIDISNIELKSERLILRPWKLTDLDDFFEYASVDGVGQMAGWNPHKCKEESLEILTSFIQNKNVFAIQYGNKVIGSFGIEKYNETSFPEFNNLKGREFGFVLSKEYWGKGLIPEAIKLVSDFVFEKLKLDFILCGHFPFNKQSARAQEKCGFKPYKVVEHVPNRIHHDITIEYTILYNNYETKN